MSKLSQGCLSYFLASLLLSQSVLYRDQPYQRIGLQHAENWIDSCHWGRSRSFSQLWDIKRMVISDHHHSMSFFQCAKMMDWRFSSCTLFIQGEPELKIRIRWLDARWSTVRKISSGSERNKTNTLGLLGYYQKSIPHFLMPYFTVRADERLGLRREWTWNESSNFVEDPHQVSKV